MPHTVTAVTPDPPAQLNLSMSEATTFNVEFTWLNNGVAQSLVGYSAKLSVGRRADAAPIFTVTSQAGEIVLTPSGRTGVVSVAVPASKTALLSGFGSRLGRYDLVVVAGDGTVTRLAEGTVTVDAAVTPSDAVSNPPIEVSSVLVVYGTPHDDYVPVWNNTLQRWEYGAQNGGSSPVQTRAQYFGFNVAIDTGGDITGASVGVPWTFGAGDALLDLTDPTQPTVIDGGVYALTFQCNLSGTAAGKTARAITYLDAAGGPANASQDFSLGLPFGQGAVTLIYYVPSGGILSAFIATDDTASLNFNFNLFLQRLS